MPRIRFYYDKSMTDNYPRDYCCRCFPDVVSDVKGNPLVEVTEDDHPGYDDTYYRCAQCGRPLTSEDD